MNKGKRIKRSTLFRFANLVRLPVGITSSVKRWHKVTDLWPYSQQLFVEQFSIDELTRMFA
jgi:hypothetical protein